MKSFLASVVLAALVLTVFCSCGSSEKPSEPLTSSETNSVDSSETEIDVDLTTLSSTMIFGEVSYMMVKPEKYLGKTIKMNGEYYASYYEQTDKHYHFVIIADAEACCQEGIEFILAGDYTYPDDYPKDGDQVEICGEFASYIEEGRTYYHIKTNEIKIVSA